MNGEVPAADGLHPDHPDGAVTANTDIASSAGQLHPGVVQGTDRHTVVVMQLTAELWQECIHRTTVEARVEQAQRVTNFVGQDGPQCRLASPEFGYIEGDGSPVLRERAFAQTTSRAVDRRKDDT